MDKEQFEQHMQDERAIQTEKQKAVLMLLGKELELYPMESPFEYVKAIQKDFDDSHLKFSDEYYEVLGIEKND